MMNTMNQPAYRVRFSQCVLICGAVVFCGWTLSAAQSRIIRPERQTNSAVSATRPRVATLRSSDSPEGSRITLTSDHSLSGYESYRRGDRFYVKVPATDLPRVEGMRGRGFTDVKAQRDGDGILFSFRLQPGVNAHVEQRGNRLDLVFKLPGTRSSVTAPKPVREVARANNRAATQPSTRADLTNHARETNQKTGTPRAVAKSSPTPVGSRAAAKSSPTLATTRAASPESAKVDSRLAAVASPGPSPAAKDSPATSPAATSVARPSPSVNQPLNQPTAAPVQSNSQTQTAWGNAKEHLRYWMIWAQLNWIPLAIAGGLLLIFGLFVWQRRRARAPRHARSRRRKIKATEAVAAKAAVAKPFVEPEAISGEAAPVTAGVAAPVTTADEKIIEKRPAPADPARHAKTAAIAEQMKRVMAGEDYDAQVVGSDDLETRRLVSAELLSALVGRSESRRNLAREAFMHHGYFDDATRDLRIAESPHERAAAARRLSFVRDSEATPHLIAALEDRDPDVRRTAVEALMDLRDPAAIAPLNSLLQTENDRKVSRTLIKHAIESCATSDVENAVPPAPAPLTELASRPVETEREVIEL